MIGIAPEMLLYLSYSREDFKVVCSTDRTIIGLRKRIAGGYYSEEQMAEWLRMMGCTCARPEIIIPAVIIDRHGRKFDEHTFVRLYITDFVKKELKRKLKLDSIVVKGGYLHERALKIFLKKKGAHVDTPRYALPSVWIYEPTYGESVSPQISQTVGRIIGNRLPRR